MKTITFLLYMAAILSGNQKHEPQRDLIEQNVEDFYLIFDSEKFTGSWEWEENNLNQSFSIDVISKNDSLYFSYCCVMQRGNKIDCSSEKDDYSFKVKNTEKLSFEAEFKTYFSFAKGKVKLTLQKDKLIWEIVEYTKGEYYFPTNAILKRQK